MLTAGSVDLASSEKKENTLVSCRALKDAQIRLVVYGTQECLFLCLWFLTSVRTHTREELFSAPIVTVGRLLPELVQRECCFQPSERRGARTEGS